VLLTSCSGGGDDGSAAAVTTVSSSSSTSSTTTTPVTSAPTTTAVTTTTVPAVDPDCVVTVEPGDSVGRIASAQGLTVEDVQDENRLADASVIHPGDELDVCVGNDIDDVTGASRKPPSVAAVKRQQRRLNELFADTSMPELLVDGISGPLTRQMLCAARMGLGLRVDTLHMSERSPEESALFEASSLRIPDGAATWASRWILIDKTCQVVYTGEGEDRVVDVFPTSTGEPGFETRDVLANEAFRFDPALDNDGWHDSANFPVEIDNPLNGNMYKPLYFNRGQAIHGANYVPPEPRSKGCARLFPWHQDRLLRWLGLDELTESTWNASRLGVTVTVQGDYRPVE
jgi:LysM repeat protein